jgi:hypothetical protein
MDPWSISPPANAAFCLSVQLPYAAANSRSVNPLRQRTNASYSRRPRLRSRRNASESAGDFAGARTLGWLARLQLARLAMLAARAGRMQRALNDGLMKVVMAALIRRRIGCLSGDLPANKTSSPEPCRDDTVASGLR